MSVAELRREVVAEGRRWRFHMGRLKAANAWFKANPKSDDWWVAIEHARKHTGAAFLARLAGGNALLAYVASCKAMEHPARAFEADIIGMDPTDAHTLWLVYFPCPYACSQLAFEMGGWSPWWDIALPDPTPCEDCGLACVTLVPADRADELDGAGSESERSTP